MKPDSTFASTEKEKAPPRPILVVEDDPLTADILKSRLQKLGYCVPCTVATGEDALARTGELRPAAVLMDIVLEGKLDGIEAAQRIRHEFDIPVIYLTSHADTKTLERATVTGPFGYIVKPFQETELRAAIEIALYRHKSEQQVRNMERWLTTTLRSIGDGVIATDKEGRITMLNPVAELLTGWRQHHALGRRFEEVFHALNEKTRDPVESPIEKCLREGVIINLEADTIILGKNGAEVSVDDSAAPIRDDAGEIIGVVVVFRDSSDRKRHERAVRQLAEQLEERVKQRTTQLEAVNRELEAFTYSVSHDLRAPIRVIDGFANALAEDYSGVLDEEGKRFLTVVCQSTQRMDKMIRDFLRLARLGHSELQIDHVNMTNLVNDVVHDAQSGPEKSSFEIKVGPLPDACCDTALIRQVWENLIGNAIKYSRTQAAPLIEIKGEVKEREVVYSIKDNGVGFDMKNVAKLFAVFQRLHSNDEFEGNGVGLAIVQRIVLRHGGRVWACGEVNRGAEFFFSLPMAKALTL